MSQGEPSRAGPTTLTGSGGSVQELVETPAKHSAFQPSMPPTRRKRIPKRTHLKNSNLHPFRLPKRSQNSPKCLQKLNPPAVQAANISPNDPKLFFDEISEQLLGWQCGNTFTHLHACALANLHTMRGHQHICKLADGATCTRCIRAHVHTFNNVGSNAREGSLWKQLYDYLSRFLVT